MFNSQRIIKIMQSPNIEILKTDQFSIQVKIMRGSNKTFTIPTTITPDLAYLVACIICDGHLRRDKNRIVFETANEKTTRTFVEISNKIFHINEKYRMRQQKPIKRKPLFMAILYGKPLILYFEKFFGIPRGKKSNRVKVPKIILNSNRHILSGFLEGVFATDGGFRGRRLGLTTASKQFRDDLCHIFKMLNIHYFKDDWINRHTKTKYYGLRIAGVPKRPKGLES